MRLAVALESEAAEEATRIVGPAPLAENFWAGCLLAGEASYGTMAALRVRWALHVKLDSGRGEA